MGQVTAGYVKASVAAHRRAYLERVTALEEAEAAKLPQHEGWMTMLPDVKVLHVWQAPWGLGFRVRV